ncbi:MAG: DNA polymerase III subunit delta [Buchnera aphidicola (Nurudea shiraii)]
MNIINSEQLFPSYFKKLSPYYIILGTEYLFIQESKKNILQLAKKHGFSEFFMHQVEYNENLEIFSYNFKTNNLFLEKKIIFLDLSKTLLTKKVKTQLSYLSNFINSNLLLIIHISTNKKIENEIWFNIFKSTGTIIYCNNLTEKTINIWIKNKENSLKINLHKSSKDLLLKYFSKNTLHLYNILNISKLNWPTTLITSKNIQKLIYEAAIFTPNDWINAILIGDYNESIRILNNFYIKNYNQIILIRYLQNTLLTILMIQRKIPEKVDYTLTQRNVLKKNQKLIIKFSHKRSTQIIHQVIKLLTKIEINVKKHYTKSIWNQLKLLSYIMIKNVSIFYY